MEDNNQRCTLTDRELIIKCHEVVKKLCDTRGQSWTLRVPPDFNVDPDLLFTEINDRYERLLEASRGWIDVRDELPADEFKNISFVVTSWNKYYNGRVLGGTYQGVKRGKPCATVPGIEFEFSHWRPQLPAPPQKETA